MKHSLESIQLAERSAWEYFEKTGKIDAYLQFCAVRDKHGRACSKLR